VNVSQRTSDAAGIGGGIWTLTTWDG